MDKHRIAIVVAEFNTEITESMVNAALDEASRLNAEVVNVYRVPGAYEIPLISQELLRKKEITSLAVLGFIEKGETEHGSVMAQAITQCLMDASLENGKPIGVGIIGPGALVAQAEVRKVSYARAAVRAAIASTNALRSIQRA